MERVVIGNFEVQCALTQTRMLKVTGVIYDTDTAADLSLHVDMAQDELDRQMVRCDIKVKEAQIVSLKENLDRMRESVDALVKKKEVSKISSAEGQTLKNADSTMHNEMKRIESLIAAVAEGKRKLGIA